MDKVKVNGSSTDPVFRYLKANLSGKFGAFIKWNFTKFLVARDGRGLAAGVVAARQVAALQGRQQLTAQGGQGGRLGARRH